MTKKNRLRFVFIWMMLSLLTACRLDFSEDKSSVRQMVKKDGKTEIVDKVDKEGQASPQKKEEPSYTFDAAVTLDSTSLQLKGKTTLPPDAVLYARLRAYPEDASLDDIDDYHAEPYMKITSEEYMAVKADGTFQSDELERMDFPQRYLLELIFAPTRAEESLQQKLVKEGESIEDLAGMTEIDLPSRNEFFEDVVPGYIKRVNIMEAAEPKGDGVTLELVSVDEE
ncbi:hypothetical protein AAEO50_13525 [Rossellomorea oryzaecorticis]|uniref:Lipoprotein n=1 Tax=Rossellomorea oryzaecorticis TaxID=1396505 RepID=A0ABU9KB20_9BACI